MKVLLKTKLALDVVCTILVTMCGVVATILLLLHSNFFEYLDDIQQELI